MIVVDGVSKRYGETVVVNGVSLALPRGGVTAIIGPNGAGKSTLLSMIARLVGLDAGRITVEDLDVARAPSRDLARRLSILRQDNHLTARLTVRDLVRFGRYPHSRGRLNADDLDHVERALGYLNLGDLAERFLDELSGGQRQRAFVAMVLAQDTPYVLLDEPLNNLDMRHSVAMMRILRQAADDLGRTVVVVLHDINFAASYCDRIVAMRDGVVMREGTPDEIVTGEALKAIYDMDLDVVRIADRPVCVFWR